MKNIDIDSLYDFLEAAEKEKFFGEIIFRYREGSLYQIVKSQSMRPEDLHERK